MAGRFSEQEKDFVRQHYPSMGGRWCAEQLLREPTDIYLLASRLKLKSHRGRGPCNKVREEPKPILVEAPLLCDRLLQMPWTKRKGK